MKQITLSFVCLFLAVVVVAVSAQDIIFRDVCRENERYDECGSFCPEHCPAYDQQGRLTTGSGLCIKMCKSGCVCVDGYVQDPKIANRCVLPEYCTPPDYPSWDEVVLNY